MKTDDLHLRIDPERKALFRKRAEEMNLNISQYFEHLMDEKPMVPALLDKEITRLRDELHYANNNLNQVAHRKTDVIVSTSTSNMFQINYTKCPVTFEIVCDILYLTYVEGEIYK